ncbi:hypothetical protein TD95_002494 [Thielaviopsis punctulata]|uniref:L-lactate dehydrogenase (cytochrome) n=1 Tax=Thielaviopsis punctulata TaxID=72032 RepID=A0A0F4ZFC0_9PEZI|nr:hypothetical protein TD95_002494 [Thielaviopsis punctulata]
MTNLNGAEVAKHNTAESCWVVIHGKVYDVTEFLDDHPGGKNIILKYAGRDASEEFDPVHPSDTLDRYLPKDKHLGPVDMSTVDSSSLASPHEIAQEKARQAAIAAQPPLSQCYNLLDFESVARRVMRRTAWAYYSSAADDEITMRENHAAFHRIWFRPKVLVDVTNVDISTSMLGHPTKMPFYVTATALGKLGHPEGEVVLTRSAGKHGVVQMIPTLASCSLDEITAAADGAQIQWLQLYVNTDKAITQRIVQQAEARGCKGLFITVDAPQLGRREKDMRSRFTDPGAKVQAETGGQADTSQGAARAISSFIDPALSWKDMAWFQSITKMPIVIKGVQRVEDVLLAYDHGLHGVVLSNHGGRQLEFSRSAIEVLAETMPVLRRRGIIGGRDRRGRVFEVFVDGGVRRGTDIIKALCLGATGVGIGRPFLYAMSAYGQPGVDKAMSLLRDELEMNMRLLGVTRIEELTPDLLDTRSLTSHGVVAADHLSDKAYEPMSLPQPVEPAKAKL